VPPLIRPEGEPERTTVLLPDLRIRNHRHLRHVGQVPELIDRDPEGQCTRRRGRCALKGRRQSQHAEDRSASGEGMLL